VATLEKLCDLLFELSSNERMRIISLLNSEGLKLSHLSQKLDITVTEASRHLQRLSETQLIQRGTGGLYHITPYGELALQQLSGLGFISDNSQYFLEHDTSHLPYKFVSRIGELALGSLNKDVLTCIASAELALKQAEEFCWSLTDQVIASSSAIIDDKIRVGTKFRAILPEKLVSPPGYTPAHGVERRTLPKIELWVLVTEKEAMFGLPFLNGQMDYAQFMSKDTRFYEWCKDLYLFYWEKAKPILYFPNI
jgi:predicted transcriptional regulator